MNPNEALWEKGDFTRIAESMRECQPTQLMHKGERMKISIFHEEESNQA